MSIQAALSVTDPPDLLRRFVPTPYCESVSIRGLSVRVVTSDERLLPAFKRLHDGTPCTGEVLGLTIVSDPELPPMLGEPLIVRNGTTIYAVFGQACFTALEQNQKTIAGFVSAEISEHDWAEGIVPVLLSIIVGTLR